MLCFFFFYLQLCQLLLCLCFLVANYDTVLETTSETDDDDQTLLRDDSSFTGAAGEDEEAGSPVGVSHLEASPRVGHTLLSNKDQEDLEHRGEDRCIGESLIISAAQSKSRIMFAK